MHGTVLSVDKIIQMLFSSSSRCLNIMAKNVRYLGLQQLSLFMTVSHLCKPQLLKYITVITILMNMKTTEYESKLSTPVSDTKHQTGSSHFHLPGQLIYRQGII